MRRNSEGEDDRMIRDLGGEGWKGRVRMRGGTKKE